MLNLDGKENDLDDDNVRKYPEVCKSIQYVHAGIDGQPGLTQHHGHYISLWTTVTPDLVRTMPD